MIYIADALIFLAGVLAGEMLIVGITQENAFIAMSGFVIGGILGGVSMYVKDKEKDFIG